MGIVGTEVTFQIFFISARARASSVFSLSLLFAYIAAVVEVAHFVSRSRLLLSYPVFFPVNNKPTDSVSSSASLLHVNDVRPVALAAARALHNSKHSAVVGLGKRSDRLAASANAYLSLGHVREFCEIQIELGAWDKALAFAPAASMSYWKLCMLRHAFHLTSGGDAQAATAYFIGSGDHALLQAHQLRMKDVQGAFLSAVCSAVNALPMLPPFEPEEEKKFATLLAASQAHPGQQASSSSHVVDDSKIERDSIPVTDAVREVAEAQAALSFSSAQPVLAACALLRIGDAMGAVQKLLLGNEVLLALAVCRVLQLQFCDEVFRRTSTICEELGLWDEALKCLLSLRDPRDELILLAARFTGPANLKAEFYLRCGIRSQEAFATAAEQHVKDRQISEALTAFVAGAMPERALTVGMEALREMLSQPSWSLQEAQSLLKPLHSINLATSLPNTPAGQEMRNQFLCYSYALGAMEAMNRGAGYAAVASFLVDSVAALVAKLTAAGVAVSMPLPLALLRMQEASYLSSIDAAKSSLLLRDVIAEGGNALNPRLKAAAAVVKKNVDTIHLAARKPTGGAAAQPSGALHTNRNLIIPGSSTLPCGGSAPRRVVSLLSRTVIEGPKINVDVTSSHMPAVVGVADGAVNLGAGFVTLQEALMLNQCTPYSPNHTGFRLKIFTA